MSDDEIIKRWQHGTLACILWTREPGAFDGVIMERGKALANVKTSEGRGQRVAEEAIDAVANVLDKPRDVWNLDPEPFTDLALAPYPSDRDIREAARLETPVSLATDLSAVPCDWDLWRTVARACDAPGENITPGIDLRGRPLYAFARSGAPRDPVYAWDSDGRLQLCITLSRLIRPTSIGFGYAARVIGRLEGRRYMIKPGPVRGFGAEAWTSEPEHNWLDSTDFLALRQLLTAFDSFPLEKKSRLAQALWYHEYACRTQLIDIRIPLISTALESLLATTGDRSTQQFIKRVPQLADTLSLPAVSNSKARRMWSLRCSLSHGGSQGGLGQAEFAVAQTMETLLRVTLKRAISEQPFRALFASRESVDAAFPMPAQAKATNCPTCGSTLDQPT